VKEEPIALPLPKNTVLMGMIEAAERHLKLLDQARQKEGSAKEEDAETDLSTSPRSASSNLDPVFAGVSALVGNCGTYAVREPLGLAVLPFDPNKRHHHGTTNEVHDEDDEEKKTDEIREPFTIDEGQKVQVVGVDEGVYQLARGAGYIVASVNQLVKVGGPLEKSCQYEGMLRSVLRKQEELKQELDKINSLVEGLKEKIQILQEDPPDYPVISSPKEIEELQVNDENDVNSRVPNAPTTPTNQGPGDISSPVGLHLTESVSSTEVHLGADHLTPAQHTPPYAHYAHSPAHSCPMPGSHLAQPFIDGEPAGLPRYRITSDEDIHGLPWTFGCGTTLFGERLIEQECDTSNIMSLSFDDGLVDAAGRVAGRSLAARTIAASGALSDGSLRSGSFDGPINFRTGMSGHTGLSLSRKKSSPMSRPHIRMMSEHRGIAATTRPHHNIQQKRPPGTLTYNYYE